MSAIYFWWAFSLFCMAAWLVLWHFMAAHCDLFLTVQSTRMNGCVELNPDPQFRSDRPEWCLVHYDRRYHPERSFQFEMQWMVATITLFNQLVGSAL